MIIKGYIKVIDRDEVRNAELTGMDIENSTEWRDESISIRADCIEALRPNGVLSSDGSERIVPCTDIHMKSGDFWTMLAPYEAVEEAWLDILYGHEDQIVSFDSTDHPKWA